MAKEKIVLEAYCMKLKAKAPFHTAEVHKTEKGKYMIKGLTKEGHSMCLFVNEATALDLIKTGSAKKAF